ncbi:uncharacterized protein DUF3568 [Allofrancisella inopinata]|uniref:DUF3568 family protein n=1 Tax=Allofrancisella inopinata TaxID=1085647 RepID=A0AAE7CRI8_9GAMM|nr:DUF3568 family protein [Allofrancisella inopinata]QIV96389.1 DUF3568 family protein [Allofrancisella inopinata]TDT73370.1 uncharacterized protein DUF3568 [Allofrancisella inopinata]
MMKKKLLTITTLLAASVALTSCTAEAVAVTGLVLASVAVGALAYEWMENPDAYNAYAKSRDTVFLAVQEVLKENNYTTTEQTVDQKKSEIKAVSPSGDSINIVVQSAKDNKDQSAIYIKDDSKANATIILNKINKKLAEAK